MNNDCACKAIKMKIGQTSSVKMKIGQTSGVKFSVGSRCCSTPSYNALPDKPQINGHTLIDNKTADELDLEYKLNIITEQQIDNLFFGN